MNIILILILSLFIYYLLIKFYDNIKKIYKKKVLDLKFWENKYQEHHNNLIDFISKVVPYLEKWKVTYWAHAGTLLGCMRHKGIIPWDDDIDFGYIDNDNIENLITDLRNNNFQIGHKIIGIEIDLKFGFQILDKNNSKNIIDMFKFTQKDDMFLQTKLANYLYPKENYYCDELFPIKTKKFNNIYLPIPNKAHKFCKRAFSNNYMDEFYIQTPHPLTFIENIIDGIGIYSICKEKFYIKDLIRY